MAKKKKIDPLRADAAPVYRYLRDHGPDTLSEIADACFPLLFGREDPLYKRLHKRSVTRALRAMQWMREQGVPVLCINSGLGTTFGLFPDARLREGAVPPGSKPVPPPVPLVTPTEEDEIFGREVMGLYGHS